MKIEGKRILLWAPRILAIAFNLFLGLFALDVFGEGYGFWGTIAAFLIHLIPNFVLVVVIFFAWKRPWVGSVFFALLSIFYIVLTRGRMGWDSYVSISLPMLIVSLLYGWSWRVLKTEKNVS